MAKRGKRRARKPSVATVDYTDPEGNVLTLRQELTVATVRKLERTTGRAGASGEDIQRRREEMLFERLVVSWQVAGLPLNDQKMLLGRYRMADTAERDWVRRTIATHLGRFMPELAP